MGVNHRTLEAMDMGKRALAIRLRGNRANTLVEQEQGESMSERPKTMHEAICDFEEAWRAMWLEFAYALKVDRLLDWLTDKIGGKA